MIKHCGFIHRTVIVILVLLICISYLSNFLKCQLKFSPNYEKSFSLQLASYSDFFSPKKKEKKEPCYSDHSICLVTTSHVCDFHIARFPAFFFFVQPQLLTNSPVNSALQHYPRVPQTPLFSIVFIKNGSGSTIHTFKNYFAKVFSVFSKNKLYPNSPLESMIWISYISKFGKCYYIIN